MSPVVAKKKKHYLDDFAAIGRNMPKMECNRLKKENEALKRGDAISNIEFFFDKLIIKRSKNATKKARALLEKARNISYDVPGGTPYNVNHMSIVAQVHV